MNTDIRIKVSWSTHPKRRKLERKLGAKGPLAFVDLLLSVSQNKPNGKLNGWTDDDIAIAAQWDGEARELVDTLVEVRLLDLCEDGIYSVHEWDQHNPYAAHAQERSEKASKAARSRWANDAHGCQEQCSEHSLALPDASGSNAPSPSPTPTPKPKDFLREAPEAGAIEPAPEVFISIPTNKSGEEFPVTDAHVKDFEALYPSVDVHQELRKMRGWCSSNPRKRKTLKGVPAFMNSWLSREQDRGGARNKTEANQIQPDFPY